MAWNDNDGRNRDQWGDRGGQQGPPDLDDAFRKLKGQLGGIFSRGGGGGSGSDDGGSKGFRISPKLIGAVVLVLIAIWGIFGFYQVDEQEGAVIFRLGEVQSTYKGAGLKWNPPIIDKVEIVNMTQVRTSEHSSLMLTEDENIVSVDLNVQYVVLDPIKHLVQIRDPEISLKHATESALRHVVGSSLFEFAITDGRFSIGTDIHQRVQDYIDLYQTGINVIKVNIDDVKPPAEVAAAFLDVQKASEDEQRFINDASRHAEKVIPEARGDAQQEVQRAEADRYQTIERAKGEAERFEQLLTEYSLAPRVTRDRLYITFVESTLAATPKVIVDVEQGNNLLLLPLDQLQRGSVSNTATADTNADSSGQGGSGSVDVLRNLTSRR